MCEHKFEIEYLGRRWATPVRRVAGAGRLPQQLITISSPPRFCFASGSLNLHLKSALIIKLEHKFD